MEGGRRSGEPSGYVVKNKNSKGCLIVRKKAVDGMGGAGSLASYKGFHTKHDKKRLRMNFSDSGSSDELLMQPQRKLGPKTMMNCNGVSGYEKVAAEESDARRKRSREEEIRRSEVDLTDRNVEDLLETKRNKLGMYEFDEYEGNDGGVVRRRHLHDEDDNCEDDEEGRRYSGSMMAGRSCKRREFETGSSRYGVSDGRKSSCFDRAGRLNQGSHGDRDLARSSMSFWRDKYDSDEPIRVQGKNGVLKVMVNKKNKIGGSFGSYDHLEADDRKGLRTDGIVKKDTLVCPPFYSDSKSSEKASSYSRKAKSVMNLKKPQPAKNGKISDRDSENSDTLLKLESENVESHKSAKTPVPAKRSKVQDMDSDDSDMSLKPRPENVDTCKPMKGISSGGEKTPSNHLPTARSSEGKVKRGTGTEKQKLRERIREMLLNSGWTIDYRPRRNRDYLDAVYINPSGTAYWSIIKAYDALLKQINDIEDDIKLGGEGSSFMPLSDDVLSQLTRNTRKKIEKELKRKQRDAGESEKAKETSLKKSLQMREDRESRDSSSREEKLSSFIKLGGKSLKGKMNGNCSDSVGSKGQNSTHHLDDSNERPVSGSTSHHGRKSKKLGRCTLLIRNSNSGLNSESDGFVPYVGKRTLLSWLIDCGSVQSSQKVRYMNRRRTKVMLEGWVTREGIHCGCCSKILTVSKFEIHAGSKLRQPFQNIYLDSGISLLDCQIEAWNKQESDEHIGFRSVDIDGDDPNDDTCGLCGDGGDLICCDSCPSTFHLSCLNIQMLPPGDWHCPNCTCKFCGRARWSSGREDDSDVSVLQTCSLCAKKYHKLCSQEMGTCHVDANNSVPCFCGNKCRELFEQLQRYLGVKHELDSGFTWSLIHRTDEDSETSLLGHSQRVECNSKLAVALSVMDECFLPIVDRRSGINLLHSVLYNCGSNFNRLNFNGFYTVILERGDEIISAASIRFHATQLAEMPFIGTRHMYRRQGMCRRLFQAIETAFSSMKIEKLIIPAISELTNTWTNVFGFTTLDESLRHKFKSMNILVFPGIDMLQKQLVEQENVNRDMTASTGVKLTFEGSDNIKSEMANKPDNAVSWTRHELCERNNSDMELASEIKELATADSDSQCPDVSLNGASMMNGSLDYPHELKTRHADSESGNKLVESAVDKKSLGISDTLYGSQEMDSKSNSDSSIENNCKSAVQGDMSTADSVLEGKSLCISDASHDVHEKNSRPESIYLVKDNAESCIRDDSIAADSDVQLPGILSNDASVFSSSLDVSGELQNPISLEGTLPTNSKLRDESLESASGGKSLIFSNTSCGRGEENGDNCNAPALNLNESASDDLQVSASVEENTPDDKSNSQTSNEKSLVKTDAIEDTLNIESKPVFDSTVEDNGQSCVEANSGDADSMNVDTCLDAVLSGDADSMNVDTCAEPVPSTKQTALENSAKQLDEISSFSATNVGGANENSLRIDSEQNRKNANDKGKTESNPI